MATYLELKAQADALYQQAEELRDKERSQAIADIREKMANFEITLKELGLDGKRASAKPAASAVKTRKPVAIKYRGPAGQTWTGRGQKPVWLAELIKQGRKPEEFLI
ncbi:H-NS family nucleoid-associated regulatory protein [Variovorax terrae]|uniref:H-NS histone family protein n=1 Tax=Variovorax terrae TaxID=2923278 RepID=A0A9X2AN16_9BURK|nr:H-NS histone family protein [Variovorax terrae]MCJ0764313.1 H-NS histone family protein [Variovorax terrae]